MFFLRLWLVWSVIYGAMKVADVAFGGSPLESEFSPTMLLTGTALHLWFLPFAAVVILVSDTMRRILTVPMAASLALLSFWVNSAWELPVPLAQWAFVLPSLFFGFILTRAWCLPAALAVVLVAFSLGWTAGLAQFALAVPLAVLALSLPLPETPVSNWMRDAALGIYLIHPMVIAILLRTGLTAGLMMMIAVAGVSIMAAAMLNTGRFRRLV